MQLLQLVNETSGLSYADDVEKRRNKLLHKPSNLSL
jgi:hypothetical protein